MNGCTEGPIVIVGGGIMGCSTAYWISKIAPEKNMILIEMEGIASSSSGKAGGFLARGWHGGGVTKQLHEIGFDLIEKFAIKHHLRSYRRVSMFSVDHRPNPKNEGLPWLNNKRVSYSLDDTNTAQITPKELTESFLKYAGKNVDVKTGYKVIGVTMCTDDPKRVSSVTIIDLEHGKKEYIHCGSFIICTGAWSSLVNSWFTSDIIPSLNMQGIKSTSLTYTYGNFENPGISSEVMERVKKNPGVLFCSDDRNGCHLEVYPRPNGDIYICGCGGSPYLDEDDIKDLMPKDVKPRLDKAKFAHLGFLKMTRQAGDLVESESGDKYTDVMPDVLNACLRPMTSDGLPIMGPLVAKDGKCLKNVYVNAGHNCWGILWSAVSGKALAELVINGEARCINLQPFHPSRFLRMRSYR